MFEEGIISEEQYVEMKDNNVFFFESELRPYIGMRSIEFRH